MTTSCAIVLIVGVAALLYGLMLYGWRHAVDVGVEADQELLDRLSRTRTMSSGSAMSLDSYAHTSLGYHQAVQRLYLHIAGVFILGGLVLATTGGLQLRALRRLRRRLASGEEEAAVSDEKSVLVIGLDPALIDFSQPGYAPGMDAAKVFAGLKSSEEELIALGYGVQTCLTDFGETAEAVVRRRLQEKTFDCILIGAGVRANPNNFLLFEKLINVVHQHAPHAKLCFNTMPGDTAAAVKRWL